MGFSLKETKELIKETDEQLLNKRLNERKCQIEEKIRELQQQKEGLERYQEEIAAAEQRISQRREEGIFLGICDQSGSGAGVDPGKTGVQTSSGRESICAVPQDNGSLCV